MSVFLKRALKAIEIAGLGTTATIRGMKDVPETGEVCVELRGAKSGELLVFLRRGSNSALVTGDIGNLPRSVPSGAVFKQEKPHWRTLLVKGVLDVKGVQYAAAKLPS